MRRLSSRIRSRGADPEAGILPLINVVFLLLVFFMVVGRLGPSDPFVIQATVSATEGAEEREEPLVVLDAEGRIALDGVEMERELLLETARARIANGGSTRMRLKADGRVEALEAAGLLAELRAAGVTEALLLTERRAEE